MLVAVEEWRRDILEEHFEELEVMWNRRLRAERSPVSDALALRRLDARIDAHTDALVLAEDHATPFLKAGLEGEPPAVAAATLVLASAGGRPADARLSRSFAEGTPAVREAMSAALVLRAGPGLRQALAALDQSGQSDFGLAAAVGAVLAAHDPATPVRLLDHDDPAARALAWRAARRSAARLDAGVYRRGVSEADDAVRREALIAAAASRQTWLLDHLRQVAARPELARLEEHLLFAALGRPTDVPALLALGQAADLGWERYRVLALCGRAAAVDELLRVMRAPDPVEGALAGAAFFRITGLDVSRATRVPLLPAGAEPDELADDIRLCDANIAEAAWNDRRDRMGPARWTYGLDADTIAKPPEGMDLEARWYLELAASFRLPNRPPRFDHEHFPFGT